MLSWLKSSIARLLTVRQQHDGGYFGVLDGWRGLSILFVLAAHLLPLGPKAWRLNETAGPIGMALFFTLSGFLITHFLIHKPDVGRFVTRRFFRIVPLAWLYLLIALPILGANIEQAIPHFLFYANFHPMPFVAGSSHFWSLCVEMQFYIMVAVGFFFFKEKALLFFVFAGLGVTAFRIYDGVLVNITTYYRIDEILAGLILALAYNNRIGILIPRLLTWVNPCYVLILFLVSCHPDSGAMNYIRPYLAATLVGATLYQPSDRWTAFLNLKVLVYLASISYALYVIHPLLAHTWFGSGDTLEKYAKRPILFIVLFAMAHLSTFYYEKYWIGFAKKLTSKQKNAIT